MAHPLSRRSFLAGLLLPAVARALPPRAERAIAPPVTRQKTQLQTLMEATVWPGPVPTDALDAALRTAFERVDHVGALLDSHDPDSDIARINAAAGSQSVQVSDETFRLIRRCAEWSETSGGVFDITYATMTNLWRFDGSARSHQLPNQRELARLQKLVNFRRVILDEGRKSVMLPDPRMRLGLGGIMRGYAIDQAVQALVGAGVDAVKWRGGGVTQTQGRVPQGVLRLGIPDPRLDKRAFMGVELKDGSLCTVGDDDRFFVVKGRRYHAIIDPRTGWPARACRQASVLAPSATDAEWLSRAVFILGLPDAEAVLAKVAGAHAMVVTHDNRVVMTEGFKRRSELLAPPSDGEL